jgi:hypothetical protein
MNAFYYPNPRPQLVIERTGGGAISNCYSGASWKITSLYQLKKETILQLYLAGVVGFGQEFGVTSQCDGLEQPTGWDEIECVEFDSQGYVVQGKPKNQYTGEDRPPIKSPYFVYECWSRCDSGD